MSVSTNTIPVIAIDGPSASGKGSVAERVANALGYHYLDSGALYRIVALASQNKQIAWDDAKTLGQLIPTLNIQFKDSLIYLNGEEVTDLVRSEKIGNGASQVAVHPEVRNALLDFQHQFRQAPGLVADGRDMATVVFTDATLKIFLTAGVEIRADRRYKQLIGNGIARDYDKILEDLKARDLRDRTRSSAPLIQSDDAVLLDTDNRNIDEAVAFVLSEYKKCKKTSPNQH